MKPSGRVREMARTTPGVYRLWSVAVAVALVAVAFAASRAASTAHAAAGRVRENTGPVLVATQSLLASLAEADAAATAAFLSGPQEDREQRRLYEEAIARANVQSEEISALIGDDAEAHDDLKALAVRVTRYAGLIEAARATKRASAPGAEQYLLSAIDALAAGVREDAAKLTAASERRLERDEQLHRSGVALTGVVSLFALGALGAAQVVVARRSRRVVNPLLALATVGLLGTVVWLIAATGRAAGHLDAARDDGYDAIELTATIQQRAFGAKTDEAVALIASDPARRGAADAATTELASLPIDEGVIASVRAGRPVPDGGLLIAAAREADSPREGAAVAEMLVRWRRYLDSVAAVRAAPPERATAIAVGPASATFNGFNFSVESVLAGNRDQFLEAVGDAERETRGLAWVALVVPLLAAAAALAGFQLRINEYR